MSSDPSADSADRAIQEDFEWRPLPCLISRECDAEQTGGSRRLPGAPKGCFPRLRHCSWPLQRADSPHYSENGMDGPSNHVSLAGEDRVEALAPVFGRAFENDPMMLWSIGGEQSPAERFTCCFTYFLEAAVKLDLVWEVNSGKGGAVWIPPGRCDQWQVHPWNQERILQMCDDAGDRYNTFWSWIDVHSPNEPLWHLDSVAVDRKDQRRGYGGALIQAGLAQAKSSGLGAFLSTGAERNVAIYSRYGFRVAEHLDAPDGGPHIWFMEWEP
jgi:ribosomal protein S18 acetylase RimI-like enzyme